MKTIKIYGRLAKIIGQKVFRANVNSVGEAVRFLVANFPHIEQHMADQWYRVKTGKLIISKDEIHNPVSDNDIISITPVIAGAGSVGNIIAGALLIGVSFLIPGVFLFGIALQPIVFSIGASLVLGGVAQLLTPTPATPDESTDPTSYNISGVQNTTQSGYPVPVVYGEMLVGSVTISIGVSSESI